MNRLRSFLEGSPRRGKAILASWFGSWLLVTTPGAIALPQDGQITHGQGSINQTSATHLQIQQQSQRMAAEFGSFDIGARESVNIAQPGRNSMFLGRVIGESATSIFGTLTANGSVMLVNPRGVVFGPTARVDTASLIATTLGVSVEQFMSGALELEFSADAAGRILNEGVLRAAAGGSVTLLGDEVINDGLIVAQLGRVDLASGSAATLTFDQEGLIGLAVTRDAIGGAGAPAAVSNTGEIDASGGRIFLTAAAARDLFTKAVNNDGILRANAAEEVNGEIRLFSAAGDTYSSGTIEATSATGTGGSIEVLGDRVAVTDGRIDASGATGGGEIRVGGDYQGLGDTPTARQTFVGPDAVLAADATDAGDGGRIIVWADDSTRFLGTLRARAGATGGDGGFAEISGKETLAFAPAEIDLRAPLGSKGTLLLDPKNINIVDAGADNLADNDMFAENAAGDSEIDTAAVVAALDNANLRLEASNDITVTDAIDASGNADPGDLTLRAGRSVIFGNDVTLNGGLDVEANTDDAGVQALNRDAGDAVITTTGSTIDTSLADGAVSLRFGSGANGDDATGLMALGAISSGTGTITIDTTANDGGASSVEDVALNGAILTTGNVSITAAELTQASTITAAGLELLVTGPVTLEGANDIDTLAAAVTGVGSALSVNDVDDLSVGSVNTTGVTTNGGAVTLTAAGAVVLDQAVTSAGGAFTSSGTDFTTAGSGAISTGAGDVDLDGHSGAIDIGAALTTAGGDLLATSAASFDSTGFTLSTAGGDDTAGGAVTLTTSGAISMDDTITTGGAGTGGGAGQAGGAVALDAGTTLSVGGVATNGGAGDTGQAGGAGGSQSYSAATSIALDGTHDSAGGAGNGAADGAGGAIAFVGPVILASNTAISTGATAGDISFSAAVDATTPFTETLDLTAGTGSISFDGLVGNGSALGETTIVSADGVTLDDGFTAASLLVTTANSFQSTGAPIVTTGADGADGGDVTINTTGSLTSGTITALGGAVTGAGGRAGGNVDLNAGGFVTVDAIDVSGSDADGNFDGGAGGSITLSGDGLSLAALTADGGAGVGPGVIGGAAGDVRLSSATGGVVLFDVSAVGGAGGGGAPGTDGIVSVASNSGIAQSAATSIIAGDLALSASTANLAQAGNAVDRLAATITGAGSLTFVNSQGFAVASVDGGAQNGITTGTGAVDLTATAGVITLNADVTTSGADIDFDSPVVLGANVAVSSGAAAGTITFGSTLDASTAFTENLMLTAGTGGATFTGAVGAGTALGDLEIVSADVVNLETSFRGRSLTSDSTTFDATGAAIDVTGDADAAGGSVDIATTAALATGAITAAGGAASAAGQTGGTITLDAEGALTVAALDASGSAAAAASGQGGGAGGSITLTGATLTPGGAFLSADGGAGDGIGIDGDGGSLSLTASTGDLDFGGGSVAGGGIDGVDGAISLTATAGNVTQSAAIAAGALVLNAGADITLTDVANEFGMLTFNAAGGVAIAEATGLVLSGASSADSLALTATDGTIVDDGAADLAVTNNASFTANGTDGAITLDDAYAFGSLTFDATGAVVISEADDTVLSSTSTAASLDLASTGALGDDGSANLTVTGLADLAATSITLDDSHDFGTLTFNSAGAVSITEATGLVLSGASSADSLALTATDGTIIDDGTADLAVTNNASFTANGTDGAITLDDAYAFGSLTFDATGAVVISEADDTVLSSTSTAASLDLASTGALGDDGSANLTVTGLADLAGTSIALDDSHDFGTLTFNSAGAVSITEATGIVLSGASSADSLALTATDGTIVDDGAADLAVTNNASFTANGTDGAITLDDAYAFGSLTFDATGAVVISEADDTVLSSTSTAASLDLASTGALGDDGSANLTVTGLADLAGTSIALDDSHDFGTLTFNSAGAVSITEATGIVLSGASSADSLALTATDGTIIDDGTAELAVTNNASFTANGTDGAITLDDSHDFGTLTFDSVGAVSITEAAGVVLSGASTATSLALTASDGTITDDSSADLDVTGTSAFTANGTGGTITLDEAHAFGSLAFDSTGAVVIAETGDTVLSGTSTALSLELATTGTLTNDATADVTVTNLANLTATAISLGDQGGDSFDLGELRFDAAAGAGAASFGLDAGTVFNGLSRADTLVLSAAGPITGDGTADVGITNAAAFTTTGAAGAITLNDTFDFGTLQFAATGAVTVVETGSDGGMVLVGTSTANGGADLTAAVGDIELDGDVATGLGTQVYRSAVLLNNGDRTLTGSTVSFTNTLDGGGNALNIVGALDLDGAATGLTALDVSAASNLGADVTTSAMQSYGGLATLSGGDRTLTAGSGVRFGGGVAGGGSALIVAGDLDLNAAASGLGTLSVTGASELGAGVASNGNQTYAGAVTISGATVDLMATLGTVRFQSAVAGASGTQNLDITANLDLDAPVTNLATFDVTRASNLGANVTTTGVQSYGGATTLSNGARTLTGSTVALGAVNGGADALTITGALDLDGSATNLATLAVSGTSDLGGNVTTSGAQTYSDSVTLSGGNRTLAGTLITLAGVSGDDNGLAINGSLDLNAAATGLTTVSVSGASDLGADVGSSGNQSYTGLVSLGAATVELASGGTVALGAGARGVDGNRDLVVDGALDLDGALTTNIASVAVSGVSNLGADVTTTGSQTFGGAATLSGGDRTLTGTSVALGGVVGGGNALSIVGNLDLNGAAAGLTTVDVSGASDLGAGVASTGAQRYSGATTISAATVGVSASGVSFASNVVGTGANALMITGDLDLGGAASGLGSLAVSGTSNLGGNVTTTGAQSYGGVATLSDGNRTLTGSTVALSGVAGGGNGLAVVGALDLNAAASGLTSLSVSGSSDLGANVTSSGAQSFAGAATVSTANLALQGSAVTFGDTLTGATGGQSIAITGDFALDGAASDLAAFSVSGTSDLGGDVATSGAQSYTGAVTFSGGDRALTASMVNLAAGATGAVGNENLTITGGLDLDAALSGIGALAVFGTSNLGANVSTDGSQSFGGAVTLGTDIALATSNDSITFTDVVNGASALTLNAGTGNIDFNEDVGVSVALGDLAVLGAGQLNFGEDLVAASLSVAAGATTVSLTGDVVIAGITSILSSGGNVFGDDGDTLLFRGGLDAAAASATLNGAVQTAGAALSLGDVVLSGASSVASTADGNGAGAAIDMGVVSARGESLSVTGGAGGSVAIERIDDAATVNLSSAAQASVASSLQADRLDVGAVSALTVGGAITLGTLDTSGAGAADLTFNGGGTVTADTIFGNSGTISLGDGDGDRFQFSGGLDTRSGALMLGAELVTVDQAIDVGIVSLLGDSLLDTTNGGDPTASGARLDLLGALAGVTGTEVLELRAGTGAVSVVAGVENVGSLFIRSSGTLELGDVSANGNTIRGLANNDITVVGNLLDAQGDISLISLNGRIIQNTGTLIEATNGNVDLVAFSGIDVFDLRAGTDVFLSLLTPQPGALIGRVGGFGKTTPDLVAGGLIAIVTQETADIGSSFNGFRFDAANQFIGLAGGRAFIDATTATDIQLLPTPQQVALTEVVDPVSFPDRQGELVLSSAQFSSLVSRAAANASATAASSQALQQSLQAQTQQSEEQETLSNLTEEVFIDIVLYDYDRERPLCLPGALQGPDAAPCVGSDGEDAVAWYDRLSTDVLGAADVASAGSSAPVLSRRTAGEAVAVGAAGGG